MGFFPILLHYLPCVFFYLGVLYLISIWGCRACKIFVCFMVRFRALTHRVLHAIIVSAVLTVLKLAGKIADAVTVGEKPARKWKKRKSGGAKLKVKCLHSISRYMPLTAHRSRLCIRCSEWSRRSRAGCTASGASSSAWA